MAGRRFLGSAGSAIDAVRFAPLEPECKVIQFGQPLSADELQHLVANAIAEAGATSKAQMGAVMKIAVERAAGRADGKALSAAVSAALQ